MTDSWPDIQPFVYVATEHVPVAQRCDPGQRFFEWGERLIDRYLTTIPWGDEGVAQINQALFLLQDGYFNHRAKAPREHQDTLDSSTHQCLYAIYVAFYDRITDVRLCQQPVPMIVKRLPKPKPLPALEPPVARVYDTPLEEDDDDTAPDGSGEE